jgi:hypothetical protein
MDLIIGWSLLAGTLRKIDITRMRSTGHYHGTCNYKNMSKSMLPKKIHVTVISSESKGKLIHDLLLLLYCIYYLFIIYECLLS